MCDHLRPARRVVAVLGALALVACSTFIYVNSLMGRAADGLRGEPLEHRAPTAPPGGILPGLATLPTPSDPEPLSTTTSPGRDVSIMRKGVWVAAYWHAGARGKGATADLEQLGPANASLMHRLSPLPTRGADRSRASCTIQRTRTTRWD
jgi:hypothetical protein